MEVFAKKECASCGRIQTADVMKKVQEEVLSSKTGWGAIFGKTSSSTNEKRHSFLQTPKNHFKIVENWYCTGCAKERNSFLSTISRELLSDPKFVLAVLFGLGYLLYHGASYLKNVFQTLF